MTSTDRASDISEAMWELDRRFGLGLSVADHVSVARLLAGKPASSLTAPEVRAAFAKLGVAAPSSAYAKALILRIDQIVPRPRLLDVLREYRRFAIRELSGQFGSRTRGQEEPLRNNLLTFLPERGYTEARTGRGRTDILIPSPKTILEVKVWESLLAYEDGLTELERYIQTEQALAAFMVVFADRVPLPSILSDHGQEVAEERALDGLVVPVVVVPFEVDQPSKAGRNKRKRDRVGRK